MYRYFSPIILFFLLNGMVYGQGSPEYYKINKVSDHLWTIVENNVVNIYVVEGKDSALVIDTGYGFGDLKACVQSLTNLPLIVVNTHMHVDHAGNDHQFDKVYLHSADFEFVEDVYGKEQRKNNFMSRVKDMPEAEFNAKVNVSPPTLIPVKEGHIFDLGGRKLEVIEVPGHTPGSICLLDSENKILFAGDHINAMVWLFLDICLPLEVYQQNLKKVEKYMDAYDIIMPGHNAPLKKDFMDEITTCVQRILDGNCTSEPYNYSGFTSGARICKYKSSEVAYDPEKLFWKK